MDPILAPAERNGLFYRYHFTIAERGREVFYIRTGNATRMLEGNELLDYCHDHWPDRVEGPPTFTLRSGEKARTTKMFGR